MNIPVKVVHHSPVGWEWGYGGSGPADLALNILLHFVPEEQAWALHQDFKWVFLAPMPIRGGILSREVVLAWVRTKEVANG